MRPWENFKPWLRSHFGKYKQPSSVRGNRQTESGKDDKAEPMMVQVEILQPDESRRGTWLGRIRVFIPIFAALILIFSVGWLGRKYLLPQEHVYKTTSLPPLAISVCHHPYVSVGDQEEISITATNIGTATITSTTIILSYMGTLPIAVAFDESNAVDFSELKSGEKRTKPVRILVNQLDKDLLKQAKGRDTVDFDLLVAYDDKMTPTKIGSCQVKILQIFRLRWVLTGLASLLVPFLLWIGKELWKRIEAAF